ncbi:YoaK family protein [Saccharopolyspora phatthalungensis]|uniref:Uncharacterized membrane protein YoaK (UPF0700 family) n=1 Tax=Saccharopolyspora phatthalungensis TaxID=664693 RepID=A0A840QJJ3_9PSEU|nr:YoaK family protein [Saccharopolyspora phatthalungensis]MBB5159115.1 uncharacterized membrane protein YoaK (UPF0700 family) [Saccharopolyspora phatthalungensis]
MAATLVLTFSTGVADAVGYLALDKVFTGNMTGNVVILGMGIAGAARLPVAGPVLALAAFMAGATVGGRSMRGVSAGWTPRSAWLLTVVGLAFAAATGLAVSPVTPHTAPAFVLTALLAAGMGLQASVARHIGVKDVTTVVVTSTITGLAADSWIARRARQPWFRRASAIVLIGAGASLGAVLVHFAVWAGVALPAILTLLVAVTPWIRSVTHRSGKTSARPARKHRGQSSE